MPSKLLALPVILVFLSLAGCRERILHDLDEIRANRISVILHRSGIEAQKVREGTLWSIAVPSAAAQAALQAIEDSRAMKLPPPELSAAPSSLIPTQEERSHFFERAAAASLEQTLERIPGVYEARVHLNTATSGHSSLRLENKEGSSSVLLVSSQPEAIDEGKVKKLVAGGAGIKESSITVVSVREQASSYDSRSMENAFASELPLRENQTSKEVSPAFTVSSKLREKAYAVLELGKRTAAQSAAKAAGNWKAGCGAAAVLLLIFLLRQYSRRHSSKKQNTSSSHIILSPPKKQQHA